MLIFKSKMSEKVSSFTHFTWTFRFSHLFEILESVSVKAVIAHIFQPGVRNWSVSVSWREIEVFNLQA